jgi:hypothetical protein
VSIIGDHIQDLSPGPDRGRRGRARVPRLTRASAGVPAAVPVGVLATIAMDGAMIAAGRLGGSAFTSDRIRVEVVGRWSAGLMRGRWCGADITAQPAQPGELALGLLAHYAMGIVLTQAFLLLARPGDGRPSVPAATAFGIATAALPLLWMYPSMGYGWLALRSGEATRINRIMLIGHTTFGLAIGLWAPRFAKRRPPS